MHPNIPRFLQQMKNVHPRAFEGKLVEHGSLDVNGHVRSFFRLTQYAGVDIVKGNGVSHVSLFHEFKGAPDGHFDFALSTESLEFDPHWQKSVQKMIALVRLGGSVLITCSAPGRPAHASPSPQKGYYEPRSVADIASVILGAARFEVLHLEETAEPQDVRVFAYNKLSAIAAPVAKKPAPAAPPKAPAASGTKAKPEGSKKKRTRKKASGSKK